MSWHPFSGPWGAFLVGMLAGAWVITVVWGISLRGWRGWLGMAAKRLPAKGETWTMQPCTVHGQPGPYPYGGNFPACVSTEITELKTWHKDLVECGCMEPGKANPRLHDAPEKR